MKEEATQTRIALLEQNHKTIMEQFKNYSEENTRQHIEVKEMIMAIDDKLQLALDKKANKWVETSWTWVLYTVGGILITAFMWLIIKDKL